jgi:hypothetical protein
MPSSVTSSSLALLGRKQPEPARNVACRAVASRRAWGLDFLDHRKHRPPRESAPAVAVEIEQNGKQPCPEVAAVKEMLAPKGAHERVLDEIIGDLSVAGERAGEAPKRGNQGLEAAAHCGHGGLHGVTQRGHFDLSRKRTRAPFDYSTFA